MKRSAFADYPQLARERVIDALQDIAKEHHDKAEALQGDNLEALEDYHRNVAGAAWALALELREAAR